MKWKNFKKHKSNQSVGVDFLPYNQTAIELAIFSFEESMRFEGVKLFGAEVGESFFLLNKWTLTKLPLVCLSLIQ